MIDVQKNISQKVKYETDFSQLVVTYDTAVASEHYSFDNVVFARLKTGMKQITFSNQTEMTLLPNMVVMLTKPIDVDVRIPFDIAQEPTFCYSLEIEKKKIWQILERIYDTNKLESITKNDQYAPALELYYGINSQMVIDVLDQLQRLLVSESPFKDRWLNIKLEELLLCCLQTNIFEALIHSYQEAHLLNTPLAAVVKYLKENAHKKIQITELTKLACMSQASLFRHFKNNFGKTPHEFINHERLRRAAKLLTLTDINIGEVGYSVGYTSPSHFNTQFRKMNNCSPSEYRRKNRLAD